jgi:hypothetical protein
MTNFEMASYAIGFFFGIITGLLIAKTIDNDRNK